MMTEITETSVKSVEGSPRLGGLGGLTMGLTLAVAMAGPTSVPAWGFMWLLAVTIFLGCKWLTLYRARLPLTTEAVWSYVLLWPGMDARGYFGWGGKYRPKPGAWLAAVLTTGIGAWLVGWAARGALARDREPLLQAWVGMVGMATFLHFGIFRCLYLIWRSTGREVEPLMRAPLLAKSVAEFWGYRWNTAFHLLAHELVFCRIVKRCGVRCATLAVFLVSGLIHDLVISVPAGGGYGWPTAYFLLQGSGVLLERSGWAPRLGLGPKAGWRRRFFAVALVAGPAFWLFHPPFVENVIIPMLQCIGRTLESL